MLMHKIKKLSRFFKWVFATIVWGWPIVLFVVWFQDSTNTLKMILVNILNIIPQNLNEYLLDPLSLNTKIWGLLVSSLPAVVGMSIAFSLMRLFACYEKGAIFTHQSILYIRRVGIIMFIWALLNPLYQIFMSLVLTWHNPVGQRAIALGFDFDYFRNLIVAGIVLLISHIMQEAIKLKNEQDLTV